MGLCVTPQAASAVDWSVRSTASETVELNSNMFLVPSPLGGTAGSYSTISANAEARAPTSKFDFDSNVNYSKYWGPGASTLPDTENLSYGFTGHYEMYGKSISDRSYLDAGYRRSSAPFALLGELGLLTNVKGGIDTYNFGGGIDRTLSALDTVSLSARSTLTSYDPSSAGTAFTDTSASGTWRHRLTSLTALNVTSSAEWLAYDNALATRTLILRNQAGIEATLSPVLSFRGMWGAAYVQVENGGGTSIPIAGAPPTASSGGATGFITDMFLTYQALKGLTFTLNANQSVSPSVVGSLFQSDSIRATVAYTINSRSSLTLAADGNRITSTGTTDLVSASASYSYQLAREWTVNLSYRFLHSFGSSGGSGANVPVIPGTIPIVFGTAPASSHSVVVVVSKSFTLLAHTD